ncbi:MAG TPA: hypothetical protein VNJ03_11525 [Vicinamibacterales bacterium]|nr:hypothetical protein [Vicinamibacterales bacterium]
MSTRFQHALAAVLITAALPIGVSSASAQARTQPQPPSRPAAPAPAAQAAPPLNQNASETRRDFYEVLNQYPPALGRVLRLDPTLMTNPNYLASYPQVSAFVAQYPDVPRNPGFYLERYDGEYASGEPPDARRAAVRMWEDVLAFFGAFTVFCVVTFSLFSLIKYIVEYRRWSRISKVNAEVHNKILDRFASNEELLAYIDSPAGRRFLEASPIAPSAGAPPRSVGAPFARILWSVQLGILLMFLAAGLYIISGRVVEEIQQVMLGLSVIGFCLGLGFVLSAAASYVLSRRLGLLHKTPNEATEPNV